MGFDPLQNPSEKVSSYTGLCLVLGIYKFSHPLSNWLLQQLQLALKYARPVGHVGILEAWISLLSLPAKKKEATETRSQDLQNSAVRSTNASVSLIG